MVAPATSRASSPCHEWPFTLPSRSVFHAAHIPVLSPTTVVARYDADVLRPAKVPQGVRLPGVVLLHGRGGAKCALWWAARLLAGRGYESRGAHLPVQGTVAQAEPRGATAARAALAWLRSSANPYRSKLKANDLAVMGHSLGATSQDVQQDASLPYVKTIVALDNLRRYLIGDPGGAVSCDPSTLAGPITPRVPALGLGSLTGCPPPDQALTDKTTGYKNWRAAGCSSRKLCSRTATTTGTRAARRSTRRTVLSSSMRRTSTRLARAMVARRHNAGREARAPDTARNSSAAMLANDTSAPAFTSSAFLPSKECPELRACH